MSARQIIPQTHDPCALCHKPAATKRCGRCRAVVYCSRDCQARHWKSAHKLTCGAAPPPVPPRPQTPGELAEDCARQLAERGYADVRSAALAAVESDAIRRRKRLPPAASRPHAKHLVIEAKIDALEREIEAKLRIAQGGDAEPAALAS